MVSPLKTKPAVAELLKGRVETVPIETTGGSPGVPFGPVSKDNSTNTFHPGFPTYLHWISVDEEASSISLPSSPLSIAMGTLTNSSLAEIPGKDDTEDIESISLN